MTSEQKMTRLLLQASEDLQKIHDQLIKELSKVAAQNIDAVTPNEFYSIAEACTPAQKAKVQALLDEYRDMVVSLAERGMTRAVSLSASNSQLLLAQYTKFTGEETEKWREKTAKAFIQSRMKRDKGLSLSDRVWNYTQQTKAEFELAVSQAIEDGISNGASAERLGRWLRARLNNPDMMYRRYHRKKVLADGTKKDIVEWRRRVVGADGKVHFVKEDLAAVGTGVYRSARQNALRLTITETNMAYNYANCKRWTEEPFVLGIRIRLSGNHPAPDICDTLQGEYPRDFMWRGWHPRCRCSQSPILMDRDSDEWKKLRAMDADEYKKYKSPNRITAAPAAFQEWCEKNKEKLTKAREAGKLPYFVRDNEKSVGKLLGWDKTIKPEIQTKAEEINTALNKEYKGGAVGKNLLSSVDTRKMVSIDPFDKKTFTYNIARIQGFDAPAKLVGKEEFDKLVEANKDVFYRTVNKANVNGKDMSADEFASQMYTAEHMAMNGTGLRVYGDGIYVASAAWNGEKIKRLSKTLREKAYQGSRAYGKGECKTLEMTWTRKPKTIERENLIEMWKKMSNEEKREHGGNENAYACLLGYDAIYCNNVNYIVILNRTIIAVKAE